MPAITISTTHHRRRNPVSRIFHTVGRILRRLTGRRRRAVVY